MKITHDNYQCIENLIGNCENIKYSNVKPSNFPNSHKIKSYIIQMTLKVTLKTEEKLWNDWWLYILFLNIKNSWSSHRLNLFERVITRVVQTLPAKLNAQTEFWGLSPVQTLQECKIKYTEVHQDDPQKRALTPPPQKKNVDSLKVETGMCVYIYFVDKIQIIYQ